MPDQRARVADEIRERGHHFHVVAGAAQRVEQRGIEAVLDLQAHAHLAPGAAQQPARRGHRLPQSQAAVFSRYAMFGQDLQQAVTAPRWLLGRTWGQMSVSLKVEDRLDPAVVAALREAGHDVELIAGFSDFVGHAGALVRHPNGMISGASDPRSDGLVAAL